MKFLFNSIYYIFVTAVLALALVLILSLVPIPGNYKIKIVKSGSMEPAIKTGAIVVIKPADSYKVGDIVTFGEDTATQIPTTHRIIGSEGEGQNLMFQTKGDANDTEDQRPISVSEVNGKVILDLPYVGYMLDFAKKPLGFALLVGIPAVIVIVDEIMKIVSEIRRIKRKKLEDENVTE